MTDLAGTFAKANTVVVHALAIRKTYEGGRIGVLDQASFDVFAGELVALLGAAGAGKSTLLHLISGLAAPDLAELSVCGLDPREENAGLELRRTHVGFVFSRPTLLGGFTVAENLRVPALAAGARGADTKARVLEVAALVGLADHLDRDVGELSAVDRQRVAIGRALFNRPQLILADEPTGSVNEADAGAIFALLRSLVKETGVAILLATQDREFAGQCDRVLHLRGGRVEQG